jgi:hypothetical protein
MFNIILLLVLLYKIHLDKCSKIKKVGEPIVHHHSGYHQGTWMRDPLGLLGPEKIWYMNNYYGNKVLEFEDMDHFKAGEVAKTYTLPYYFDGTGSVVYGRYLYFNRSVRISLALEQEFFIEIFSFN